MKAKLQDAMKYKVMSFQEAAKALGWTVLFRQAVGIFRTLPFFPELIEEGTNQALCRFYGLFFRILCKY